MNFIVVPQEELDVALEALTPIIGKGHSIEQDGETGFIEIKPCSVAFEPCEVEVTFQNIVEDRTEVHQGFQPQVLRHQSNYPHEPDDYDYCDLGEPQSTFLSAVVELASELAAEMVGNRLADWAEAKAWEEEEQGRENFGDY
jgi:hypothetical protein